MMVINTLPLITPCMSQTDDLPPPVGQTSSAGAAGTPLPSILIIRRWVITSTCQGYGVMPKTCSMNVTASSELHRQCTHLKILVNGSIMVC
jgi:hypothetical protein